MSLYIGKDSNNKNILHITSDTRPVADMKTGVVPTSVINSSIVPFEVIYEEEITFVWYNHAYASKLIPYANNMLMGYIFGNNKNLLVINTSYNGNYSNSNVFNCNSGSKWASIGTPYYDVSTGNCMFQVNGRDMSSDDVIKATYYILDFKVGDSIQSSTGPCLISGSDFSIGTYDIKNKKVLCNSATTLTGEKVMQSNFPDENWFSYKNYNNLVTSFSADLDAGTIKRGGVDFIGGTAGKILMPIAVDVILNTSASTTLPIYTTANATIANNVVVYYRKVGSPAAGDIIVLYAYNNISTNNLVRMFSNMGVYGNQVDTLANSVNIIFNRVTGEVSWNKEHIAGGEFTFVYFY